MTKSAARSTTPFPDDDGQPVDPVAAAQARLDEAEQRLATLRREEELLAVEKASLRPKMSTRGDTAARARMEAILERASDLYGRAVTPEGKLKPEERARLTDADREERRRRAIGEIEVAVEAVRDAKELVRRAESPAPTLAVAERMLADAERHHEALVAEQRLIPGQIRAAAIEGDVDRQVELTNRSHELPLHVFASRRRLTEVRLAHAMASIAGIESSEEPDALALRRLRETAHQLKISLAEQARDAESAAMSATAPVVQSLPHTPRAAG